MRDFIGTRAVIGKRQTDRETIIQETVKHQTASGDRETSKRSPPGTASLNRETMVVNYLTESSVSLCASALPFSLKGHRSFVMVLVGLPFPTAGIILTKTVGLNRTTRDAALSS